MEVAAFGAQYSLYGLITFGSYYFQRKIKHDINLVQLNICTK